jgi:hypothetical protein
MVDEYDDVKKIECKACGREVLLYDSWANTCDCGAEYNGFGQRSPPAHSGGTRPAKSSTTSTTWRSNSTRSGGHHWPPLFFLLPGAS